MHESISGVKKNLKGLVNVISIRCIGHFCYSKPSQLGAGCRRGYIHGRYSHSGQPISSLMPGNFQIKIFLYESREWRHLVAASIRAHGGRACRLFGPGGAARPAGAADEGEGQVDAQPPVQPRAREPEISHCH